MIITTQFLFIREYCALQGQIFSPKRKCRVSEDTGVKDEGAVMPWGGAGNGAWGPWSVSWQRILSPNDFFFFLASLGLHPWHMEVLRLGVKSELQLPAYTTATDLSCICDLQHSSWQHQILDPLRKVRDGSHILMDTSLVGFQWAIMGIPPNDFDKS